MRFFAFNYRSFRRLQDRRQNFRNRTNSKLLVYIESRQKLSKHPLTLHTTGPVHSTILVSFSRNPKPKYRYGTRLHHWWRQRMAPLVTWAMLPLRAVPNLILARPPNCGTTPLIEHLHSSCCLKHKILQSLSIIIFSSVRSRAEGSA
jgi:hypothetical protein